MRKMIVLILFGSLLFSCVQPEPRKPVQVKSGSFYRASVERNKQILAQEEALIRKLVESDSLNTYRASDTGFWYYYEKQNDTQGYQLQTDDEVLLAYTVMNLKGDTIYRQEDIGIVQHAIDKSQLFPGLRNAIKLLKEGEKATFLFPSSQAYGFKGDDNKIGPLIPIKASLQLIEILKKRDSLN
ncbi:gliding motility-associated peptidyl-prolyl isomerase GldI [uncultured Croceitalea sp.]|uniref:gliding motility-associated peptidyl-prolyl isomerase GldI n=1 Tax=uncultured Croceitalea sp. TaxID=1798908 RepID=UPI0033068E2A